MAILSVSIVGVSAAVLALHRWYQTKTRERAIAARLKRRYVCG